MSKKLLIALSTREARELCRTGKTMFLTTYPHNDYVDLLELVVYFPRVEFYDLGNQFGYFYNKEQKQITHRGSRGWSVTVPLDLKIAGTIEIEKIEDLSGRSGDVVGLSEKATVIDGVYGWHLSGFKPFENNCVYELKDAGLKTAPEILDRVCPIFLN